MFELQQFLVPFRNLNIGAKRLLKTNTKSIV